MLPRSIRAFGRSDVADNLLTKIRGAKSERLMIGLRGGFGVGKSTVIELLRPKAEYVPETMDRWIRSEKNVRVASSLAEVLREGEQCRSRILGNSDRVGHAEVTPRERPRRLSQNISITDDQICM